jgi:peptidoglycan LD-endopeptidase LytH
MRLAWLAVAASLVAACSREPVQTVVVPPGEPAVAVPPPVAPAAPAPAAVAPSPVNPGPENPGGRKLAVPVAGVGPSDLVDNYEQSRGGRRHEAIDIMAPRGTPVHAVDDGRIAKLFTSVPGGLTIYHFDPQETVAYYYAHLDRYAEGVHEGMQLKQGDLIGYVGSTGNASPSGPHLHFAVFRLGPERQWWRGEPVNPYPMLGGTVSAPPAQARATPPPPGPLRSRASAG